MNTNFDTTFELRVIGVVSSPLNEISEAPRQPDEGAPPAQLIFDPRVAEALDSLAPGDEAILITWLDRADRTVLKVHPRGDSARPPQGVFTTRSPHRPNPIGLHRIVVTDVSGTVVTVRALEAINGTPILDLKPVLSDHIDER
jgi:tRNA-Thr(GGU) m(6)t(6)A37 methyltransferase TsaA